MIRDCWEKRDKNSKISDILINSNKVTLDDRGRIYLPKEIQKHLSISPKDTLFLILRKDYVMMIAPTSLTRKIQEDKMDEL